VNYFRNYFLQINIVKILKNWDNKTWLSSNSYINSFNNFLLKKKKLNKKAQILDIGCGRGKIFGSLSRKLKLVNKPIGIDPVIHKDVDSLIDFRSEDVFKFFKTNKNKFDLIMIKQTLHLFNKDKRLKLIKTCKNNLKSNGLLIVFSLVTKNNQIPCFKIMKQKLNRSLERDSMMIKSTCEILKNHKILLLCFPLFQISVFSTVWKPSWPARSVSLELSNLAGVGSTWKSVIPGHSPARPMYGHFDCSGRLLVTCTSQYKDPLFHFRFGGEHECA